MPGRTRTLSAARWAGLALVMVTLTAAPARAFAGDGAAADALFQAAKLLMEEKKYDQACPKFEASLKLDKTFGTLLNLADCQEKLGKVASAWSSFGEAAEWAAKLGDPREEFARKRLTELTERLPKLQINVQNPVPALEVSRDGIVLDPAVFGLALPTDPGEHRIVVTRSGQMLKEEKVDLAEKASVTINLDLEAIDESVPRPPVPPPGGGVPPVAAPPPPSSQKTVGFVVGGVGVGGVIAAAVLEALALSKKSDADAPSGCVNKLCAPRGLEAANSAATFAEVGQWVGIVSLAAVALGATLIITAPSTPDAPSAIKAAPASTRPVAWLSPWIGPSGGGVGIGGRL